MDESTCNVLASPEGTRLNSWSVRDYVLKYQINEKLGPQLFVHTLLVRSSCPSSHIIKNKFNSNLALRLWTNMLISYLILKIFENLQGLSHKSQNYSETKWFLWDLNLNTD